jgi:hypothetical protein
MTARGVVDDDIQGKATRMKSDEFAEKCYQAKHVISI